MSGGRYDKGGKPFHEGYIGTVEYDTLKLLEERLPRNLRFSSDVNFNVSKVADELRPEFNELIASQQQVASERENLGAIGQEMLSLYKIRMLTDSQEAQEKLAQRNELIGQVARGIHKLGLIREDTRKGISLLTDIGDEINSVEETVTDIGYHLGNMLQDIGLSIRELTEEEIQNNMEILQELYKIQDIFTWSHREQMWALMQILDVQKHPIYTEATEAFEIGEKSRVLGETDDAVLMLKRSISTNPTEARSYVSLGLCKLKLCSPSEAKECFRKAAVYSDNNIQLQIFSRLNLAKIEMFEGNYEKAIKNLQEALTLDQDNLIILYELALCYAKNGDNDFCFRLLELIIKKDFNYLSKIVVERTFDPICKRIEGLLQKSITRNNFYSRIESLLRKKL